MKIIKLSLKKSTDSSCLGMTRSGALSFRAKRRIFALDGQIPRALSFRAKRRISSSDRQIPEPCHSERSEESHHRLNRFLVPRNDKARSFVIQSEAKNLCIEWTDLLPLVVIPLRLVLVPRNDKARSFVIQSEAKNLLIG